MRIFGRCLAALVVIIFNTYVYSSDFRMIILTSDRGLMVSEDNGNSWNELNRGLPELLFPDKIYTGSSGRLYLTTKQSGVFEFDKNNNSWKEINCMEFLEPLLLSEEKKYRGISAFSVCNDRNSSLLLATKHSVFFRQADTEWKELSNCSGENYYTAIAGNSGRSFFAGTSYKGLFRIKGASAINLIKGIPGESYSKSRKFYEEVSAIEFDRKKQGALYAGFNFGGGVFISNNNGDSWKSLAMPLPKESLYDIYDLKFHNNSLFVSAGPGIFRMDADRKWYSVFFDEIRELASEKTNLAVMIIDRSGHYPPLFYRLNAGENQHNKTGLTARGRKAIYAGAYSLKKKLNSYIGYIKACGFNSIVIDMKDDMGNICYLSKNKTANEIKAVKDYVNAVNVLKALEKENIYLIARIVVFKDKRLYQAYNNKYAIWDKKNSKPWKGNPGEFWTDPYSEFVQDYNIEIAYELQELGFDEIQFDYIRFPSDGNLQRCQYRFSRNGRIYKSEVLSAFLKKAKGRLRIPVSLDIYGFNAWFRFGNIIGQDVEKFAETADVICPMIYPSHYGKLFFSDYPAAERPYRIVLENTKRAQKIIGGQAVIRPYIQGFNLLSPTWGPDYIRDQIKAVHEGGSDGYTFWNASGRYDTVKKAFSGKNIDRKIKSAIDKKEKRIDSGKQHHGE
ncbi:MAG: hypothetical protein JW864_03165 [Spirochaetes bacterium]|nr:hypothetical protein [Spirochaetota bacterium]